MTMNKINCYANLSKMGFGITIRQIEKRKII